MSNITVVPSNQTNITAANNAEAASKVVLAAFNGRVYMAHRGNGVSKNMYISSTSDGTSWSSETSITDSNGAETSDSPALAAFNGRLYLAYKGSNSNCLYICSSSDGINFGSQTKITDQNSAKTSAQPALAAFSGRLYLAFTGDGLSESLYVCSSSDGTNWGSQTNVTNQNSAKTAINTGPALAAFGGNLYLGWEGSSGTALSGAPLYVCASADGSNWGSQTSLSSANGAAGSNGMQLAATSTMLFALYKGSHTADIWGCGFDGTSWSDNQVEFTALISGGPATGQGTALAAMNGTFYAAYPGLGDSTSLWDFTFTASM